MVSSDSPIANELPSLSTSLLEQVREMKPDAWARMVNVFSPIVYRWARQAGLNVADSADVVQDVFVAIARNINNFEKRKEKASFRSWLATITRNRIRDSFRVQQKGPMAAGGTEALQRLNEYADRPAKGVADWSEAGSAKPDAKWLDESISLANLEGKISRRVLEIVKTESEPKTWKAFWMTAVMGDAAADVADRLQMNVASVYQAKSRILRRLRERMGELP